MKYKIKWQFVIILIMGSFMSMAGMLYVCIGTGIIHDLSIEGKYMNETGSAVFIGLLLLAIGVLCIPMFMEKSLESGTIIIDLEDWKKQETKEELKKRFAEFLEQEIKTK